LLLLIAILYKEGKLYKIVNAIQVVNESNSILASRGVVSTKTNFLIVYQTIKYYKKVNKLKLIYYFFLES